MNSNPHSTHFFNKQFYKNFYNIFKRLSSKYSQKQGERKRVIINISEDAWFGNSIGPYQHFSKSIFRAVESDSFVVRSTNKGVSAIINNKGQIIKSLKNNESGNIEYRLPIFENSGRNKNDLIFFLLLFTYGLIFLNYKKNDY